MSAFDKIYRSTLPINFFSKGWGKPHTIISLIENIENVADRRKFNRIFRSSPPITIEKQTEHRRVVHIEGSFVSPLERSIPNLLDANNRIARFQMVLPKEWPTKYRPVCLHFAGTGDHTYSRRRLFLANKLIEDGIASIIVMNPFYWKRKPVDQRGSGLNYVSDLFVMGGALVMESATLLNWCEANGYGPLALHGISMGGYMANICATVCSKPISLIPCLSWTTASVVFADGILANAVDWATLSKQYYSDSAYAKVIRPRIQPSVAPQFQVAFQKPELLRESKQSPTDSNGVSPCPHVLPTASSQPALSTRGSLKSDSSSTSVITLSHLDELTTKTLSSAADSTASLPTTSIKSFFNLDLATLKQIDLSGIFASIKSTDVLRYPMESGLWHGGLSLLRSLPDNIGQYTGVISQPPDPEVRQFLRELLDFFTHLGNFAPLVDPRLILAVAAEWDAYVPREGVVSLTQVYPDAELRVLPHSGHVGAYLRNAVWTKDFRQAIVDCLNRYIELQLHETGPLGVNQLKMHKLTPRDQSARRKH